MARGKGEGGLSRVPADRTKPLKYWEASIDLPDGTGDRPRWRARRKNKAEAIRLLRDAQAELERTGHLETKVPTVEAWLNVWFGTILQARPKTANNWRGLIANHIIPVIGSRKLDKLTPDDVRRVHKNITDKGLSSTTALQVHRVLALALKYAVREGKVSRNVATLVDAPRKAAKNLRALTLDEGLKVLDLAVKKNPDGSYVDRLGTLWAAFLLTGAREGELLGLQTDRIREVGPKTKKARALEFSWQLQRFTWEHGCKGQIGVDAAGKPTFDCGWKRGTDCRYRHITLPPDHEAKNIVGGLWLARPKTRSGWRVIPLVEPLQAILLHHVEKQRGAENPYDLVWRMPNGAPIDPSECNRMWHDLLDRAGVPQVRLHDARHTTVDLLLLAGVPVELIKDIVGHSSWLTTEDYKTRALTARHTAAMTSLSELLEARRAEQMKELEAS